MSEPVEAAERQLLRSIGRRNMLKGLLVGTPTIALWWLLSHWLMRRYGVEAHLANFGTLLLVVSCLVVLSRWLGPGQARDPRETPRLRWLMKERSDRMTSRMRRFWIVCITLAVLLWVPGMLFDHDDHDLTSGWTVVLILMGASGPNLLWRLPKTMDELERAHYLLSTQRAYALTVSLCVGALVLNRTWPGRLPGMINLSLLIGILAQQIALEIHGTRAVAHDG